MGGTGERVLRRMHVFVLDKVSSKRVTLKENIVLESWLNEMSLQPDPPPVKTMLGRRVLAGLLREMGAQKRGELNQRKEE